MMGSICTQVRSDQFAEFGLFDKIFGAANKNFPRSGAEKGKSRSSRSGISLILFSEERHWADI